MTGPGRFSIVALGASLLLGASACKKERQVTVVWEEEGDTVEPLRKGEEALRKEHEAKLAARENAPEPELNPEEPREKYELVWRMGKGRLNSIYSERAEMLAMLQRAKIDDRDYAKTVKGWIGPLTEFGLGREVASMEAAPAEICRIVREVRDAVKPMIETGQAELEKLAATTAELDEEADAGGTVYQKTWDKLDEDTKRWSQPVRAGKQLLLVVKSILEEALVLAEFGPRRAQIALRDCLEPLAKEGLPFDMAQDQIEKVVKRSKWYRELR